MEDYQKKQGWTLAAFAFKSADAPFDISLQSQMVELIVGPQVHCEAARHFKSEVAILNTLRHDSFIQVIHGLLAFI